jgi:hypothetical protein
MPERWLGTTVISAKAHLGFTRSASGHFRRLFDVRVESDLSPTAAQWRTLRCFAFAPFPDIRR